MSARANEGHIGIVVEGKGDKGAVPLLFRRILHDIGMYREITGRPVTTHGRGAMTAPGGIEGYVAAAAARPGCKAVFVIADADDDPARTLGPEMLVRAKKVTGLPVVIILAERSFEDWIYASCETLDIGLSKFIPNKRGASVISAAVATTGSKYVKPVWQPRLTSRIDISITSQRSASFRRLAQKLKEVVHIFGDV